MAADVLDRIRHRLIRWFAAGDCVLLNFEQEPDGEIRPKNLGPVFLHGVDVNFTGKPYAIYINADRSSVGRIPINMTSKQGLLLSCVMLRKTVAFNI